MWFSFETSYAVGQSGRNLQRALDRMERRLYAVYTP